MVIEKFKEKATKYTPASGTVAINNNKSNKRKVDDISSDTKLEKKSSDIKAGKIPSDNKEDKVSSDTVILNKRPKINLDVQNQDSPIGLIWDSEDYSCAYDALFTILGDIWV